MRPPVFGWLILVGWTLAAMLAAGSAIYGLHARRIVRQATEVLDTLAAKQCVLVEPGSQVRVFPPRRAVRDSLKRAAP